MNVYISWVTFKGKIYRFMFNCNNSLFSLIRSPASVLYNFMSVLLIVRQVFAVRFIHPKMAHMNHANSFDDISLFMV